MGCPRDRLRLAGGPGRGQGDGGPGRGAPPPDAAQQNARRNLDFVASASDASTFGVAFDFVAPSGKTYLTSRPVPCLPGYPRVSKFDSPSAACCPQASHDRGLPGPESCLERPLPPIRQPRDATLVEREPTGP
jgi:hypothetical protein